MDGARSIELEFVIASFSSPDSWPKDALRDELLLDPMIKLAIGWSPMMTTIPSEHMLIKNFGDQLRMPGVVAADEVGLRYCKDITAEERETQMEILKQILPVVRESILPIIVTCEDQEVKMKKEFSAMEDCFKVMKEFLPRSYPVHLTSFQGNVEHVEKPLFQCKVWNISTDSAQQRSMASNRVNEGQTIPS